MDMVNRGGGGGVCVCVCTCAYVCVYMCVCVFVFVFLHMCTQKLPAQRNVKSIINILFSLWSL